MSHRRRGVALTPMETRLDVIMRMAELADTLGYEVFALPEGWGFDSTIVLTAIALRTRQIKLMSGILSVWGRTPGTLAMSAATLYRVSGGRYVLGLGPSTKPLVEGFHDVRFEQPAERLRDVTRKVRALLAGERLVLGRVPGARPLRLGQPPVPELPIWIAALGKRAVRVAAELGDGWFPAYVARDRFVGWVPELKRLRDEAGRGSTPLTVAAGPVVVVDQDPEIARQFAASHVAWYLTAMGDVYARLVSEQGYSAEVQAIRAANPRPSPHKAIIPLEAQVILDQFAAYGPASRVREQVEPWDHTVDVVMIGLSPGLPWDSLEATVRAAAP
jgi:alkanesulfonate monooxygenase SsuD/methylene tetrahydromethanopterin reductase-like flavin-dependent oxidoreductase (luciferase family)